MARSKVKKKGALLKLPPLPDAAVHERLLKALKKMTAEEIFETSIRAGIHRRDGSLTKAYRTPRDAASAAK